MKGMKGNKRKGEGGRRKGKTEGRIRRRITVEKSKGTKRVDRNSKDNRDSKDERVRRWGKENGRRRGSNPCRRAERGRGWWRTRGLRMRVEGDALSSVCCVCEAVNQSKLHSH